MHRGQGTRTGATRAGQGAMTRFGIEETNYGITVEGRFTGRDMARIQEMVQEIAIIVARTDADAVVTFLNGPMVLVIKDDIRES